MESTDQKLSQEKVAEKAAPPPTSASTGHELKSAEVKFFKPEQNYGFLLTEHGDLFFHVTGVVDGTIPEVGAVYWYDEDKNPKEPDKLIAVNMSLKEERPPSIDSDTKNLYKWAYIPLESNGKAITDLANLALEEDWRDRGEDQNENPDEFGILRKYIRYTFTRLRHEDKTPQNDRYAAFNTGLVDRFHEPIYAFFEKNNHSFPPWQWKSFCVSGQGEEGKLLSRTFAELPKAARYFNNIEDIYFDADAPFEEDIMHIILDGVKKDRYPHAFLAEYAGEFLQEEYDESQDQYLKRLAEKLNDDTAMIRKFKNRLSDAINLARRRVSWNYRAAVPQYYPKHNQMSFLLPLALVDDGKVDATLVVQGHKVEGKLRYQGYTILSLLHAYNNARLVTNPISDWLDPKKIFQE